LRTIPFTLWLLSGVMLSFAATSLPTGVPADYTPRGTQPGLVHELQGSANCAGCHSNGPLEFHYPHSSWEGSMMANSGRDPLFWAALDVANNDGAENGAPGIGDYCLRCHAPKGWTEGRVRKDGDGGFVDGADGCLLEGDHDAPDDGQNDYQGIGCHFCHRVADSGPLGPATQPLILESGDVWLDDGDCNGSGEPCRAGPYDYATDGNPEPPHAWKFSDLHLSSDMCGTCHNVTTPIVDGTPFRTLIDASGTDTGIPFPIERTYTEWLSSDHAAALFADGIEDEPTPDVPGVRIVNQQTCQACHMPAPQPSAEAPDEEFRMCFFGPDRGQDASVHAFVGANTWVPKILKGEFPELGRELAFDQTVAWAQQMLSEQSARVAAEGVLSKDGGQLTVQVRVTNLAGHKLPTGYAEGRRMWLALEVRDADGALVFEDGAWDPATGDLHSSAQTRVYEVKHGIWDPVAEECSTRDDQGRDEFHFVLNNCIAKDNRIPPLGFTGGDDPEVAPVGAVYPPETPGSTRLVNHDDVTLLVPVPTSAKLPLTATATLRFQLASKEYIEFLRNEAVGNGFEAENLMCAGGPGRPFDVGPQDKSRGQYLYDLWSDPAYGRSPPVDMAQASTVVQP
jgi:hypothetical protein